MDAQTLLIPGGIGLFLLGMALLSDGLRALAGDGLRAGLARFTSSPARGAAAGAAATALIQSSSAVAVMTVGFVGAGLLSFPQALGVILGANVGTTLTGWVVAVVGFKLKLGLLALPLLLAGVLARMVAPGRWGDLGWAVAGFSLIFVGIDMLQSGMAGFETVLSPASLPGAGWLARLQLVALGVVVTVVTQSSSAGVAMALTALSAGVIDYPQAAAMVIGMNVGTTFTAALAAAGGSAAMRRTGLAHILFNLGTGAIALALLDPFAAFAAWITAGPAVTDPELALVAFHTLFNVAGVAVALPFAQRFAALVERLAPDRGAALTRRLDPALTADPDAAADAAHATARDLAQTLFAGMARALDDALRPGRPRRGTPATLAALARAVEATQDFMERAAPRAATPAAQARGAACLHALDHLRRLIRRLDRPDATAPLARDPRLARAARVLAAALADPQDVGRLERTQALLTRRAEPYRAHALRAAAAGRLGAAEAARRLDAWRWLQRNAFHAARIAAHLRAAQPPE